MYHVICYKDFIYFETAKNRKELDKKADKSDKEINKYSPGYIEHERSYEPYVHSFSEFLNCSADADEYGDCTRVSLKELEKQICNENIFPNANNDSFLSPKNGFISIRHVSVPTIKTISLKDFVLKKI